MQNLGKVELSTNLYIVKIRQAYIKHLTGIIPNASANIKSS